MKVVLGQNVRLVVSFWRFVFSWCRLVVPLWRFVLLYRRFDMSFRRFVMVFRRFGTPILLNRFGELPARFAVLSRLSFRRFVMEFVESLCRFSVSSFCFVVSRGHNSTDVRRTPGKIP